MCVLAYRVLHSLRFLVSFAAETPCSCSAAGVQLTCLCRAQLADMIGKAAEITAEAGFRSALVRQCALPCSCHSARSSH